MTAPDDSAPVAGGEEGHLLKGIFAALDTAQQAGVGDMGPDTFRAAGHAVVDLMADYLSGIERYPVLPRVAPGDPPGGSLVARFLHKNARRTSSNVPCSAILVAVGRC